MLSPKGKKKRKEKRQICEVMDMLVNQMEVFFHNVYIYIKSPQCTLGLTILYVSYTSIKQKRILSQKKKKNTIVCQSFFQVRWCFMKNIASSAPNSITQVLFLEKEVILCQAAYVLHEYFPFGHMECCKDMYSKVEI